MSLGAFVMTDGHHIAAWRHPSVRPDSSVQLDHFVSVAQTAQRGLFDAIFLADGSGIRERNVAALSRSSRSVSFEPMTLLAALSMVTREIGLIATVSTSFNEPYHVARKFASLDLLSGGRSGWNLVTSNSDAEAQNFNLERHIDHEDRYDRAAEFADVVTGLWDSWDEDAFPRDQKSGIYMRPEKYRPLNHQGKYFRVRGPLNVPRSPQGRPIIVQAGASPSGRNLAARMADVIFTAQQNLRDAQVFYADMRARAASHNRDPDHMRIMPGVLPFVGRTEDEARDLYESLQAGIHPDVGLNLLAQMIGGFDLSSYPLDGPVPELPQTNGPRSRQQLVLDLARTENLTLRQLYQRVATGRGHWHIIGTPMQIADQLEAWFTNAAADGFNIMAPHFPGGLEDFVTLVVPELQRRGLFRTGYEGSTLRGHLQIPQRAVETYDA